MREGKTFVIIKPLLVVHLCQQPKESTEAKEHGPITCKYLNTSLVNAYWGIRNWTPTASAVAAITPQLLNSGDTIQRCGFLRQIREEPSAEGGAGLLLLRRPLFCTVPGLLLEHSLTAFSYQVIPALLRAVPQSSSLLDY